MPLPLPPGRTGLPLLGETLAFLKNGFDFVESGARAERMLHPRAFVPQGFVKTFQDFGYNWKQIPPEPKSGLVVRFD